MGADYLELNIKYDAEAEKFTTNENVSRAAESGLVEDFLVSQVGVRVDNLEANKQDKYNIQLIWHPSDDRIEACSDTGNQRLRDGILMEFLRTR